MDLLIALIPALFWGILPVLVARTGGTPNEQIIGTTLGTLLVAAALYMLFHPAIDRTTMLFGAASGACWAFGQFNAYRAYREIGVSRAMPISTGLQLLGTTLVGVLALGEWPTTHQRVLGGLAVAIIILGTWLTTHEDNPETGGDMRAGIGMLLLATVGYVGYSWFPRVHDLNGWSAFLPQACGMFAIALLLSLLSGQKNPFTPGAIHNIGAGFVFAIGALAYLVAAERNGVATAFALSQMNVILATLGGIYVVGEKKTANEMRYIMAGLVLVVIGGIMIAHNR